MADTSAAATGAPDRARASLAGTPQTMGIPIPAPGWRGPLNHALNGILSRPPVDAHLFRCVLSHSARYGNDLARDASNRRVTVEGSSEEFSLASFLLSMPDRPSPLQRTLAWLALEAHLSLSHGTLVSALAPIMRGLARKGPSKLRDTIAKCDGPSRLLTKMARLEGMLPELGITGHKTFDSLWQDELRAFCVSLIQQAEPLSIDQDDVASSPIDQAGALTEGPTEQEGGDPDESAFFPSTPVHPEQKIRTRTLRHALDWSVYMSRQSSPDLLRPADNVLPIDLRERDWELAMARAEASIAAGKPLDAEYHLTTILSIEAGVSAREALSLAFGTATAGRIPVIDLSAHALRRPELLPPNYFIPKSDDDRWLPTGGDAIFPLSLRCVSLAKRLIETREVQLDAKATNLLLTGPVDKGKLRAAIKSHHRLVLAIGIADSLGPDAAQRAFGDTFGLSVAPAFYGAYPALDLARAIAAVNEFACHKASDAPWLAVAGHWLGSRVRPKEAPYCKVWAKLQGDGKRPRGRPSDKHVFEDWRQRRDRLAIHFLLATGHRPSRSLADMTIHDFMPKHALAIVADKVADPAHATRLVCTGWRFTGELESYIDELSRLARNSASEEVRDLASRILAGSASLFTVPTPSGPEPIDVRELLGRLDPLWSYRPNLHRHGLYQFLIQRRVDPELRYFQMGWLCHDHHATSESAPFPPAQLGLELAGLVDEWLEQCGWMGGGQAHALGELVPRASLQDWETRRNEHARTFNAALAGLRADVHEAGRSLEGEVWECIRTEAELVLSDFDASESSSRASFRPRIAAVDAAGNPLVISQLQVEALLLPFSDASCSPTTRYIATKLLHKALLKTAKDHGVRVYLPEVPILSRHREPSPFLPGTGLAVAQVDAFGGALISHAARLADIKRSKDVADLAAIAIWSIVLHTPYCDIDDAISVLRASGDAQHSNAEPWLLRVPFEKGHVVLMGDQAALSRRLAGCDGWKDALDTHSKNHFSSLGSFVRRLVPDICAPKDSTAEVVRKMVETARVASAITSNGAERLILSGVCKPVAVSAPRAAAVCDDITTTGDLAFRKTPASKESDCPHRGKNPPHKPSRDISGVMRAFDPDFNGDILGAVAEPVARRRPQLRRLLEEALSKVGAEPTPSRLMLEYAWHLLEAGGPRSIGGQAISTIYKTIHRIEPVFRGIDKDESIEDLGCMDLTAMCRQACEASRRRTSREVLGELRRFFNHVSRQYRVAQPDWDCLYRAYGVRVRGGDPALVGDAEASRVIGQLHNNLLLLDASDADPAERRYREICLVAALLAEASGARPRSIHGLTFADIVLGAGCVYIHLKARGRFASIKTRTSAGYIPLEGGIWSKYSAWFTGWFNKACAALPAEALDAIPLFQIPGEAIGVRYEMRRVFGPIGSLVRWSTQQQRGRTYWLRKRKVRSRHIGVQARAGARARDMARAMRLDGHALIVTPLAKYLSEPTAYSMRGLAAHAISTRSGAIAFTGLTARQVDRASYTRDSNDQGRVEALLRLGTPTVSGVDLPKAPELPRYRSDMTWASLERILRDLASGQDGDRISQRHSVHKQQVDSIIQAQRALAARLRVEFGTGKSQFGPPRRAGHSIGWFELLDKDDQRLIPIAEDWVDVAGGRQMDRGCYLYEAKSIKGLKDLASEMGLKVEHSEADDGLRVSLIRFEGDLGAVYGVWRALRWVLAVAWIAQYRARQR